MPVQHPTLLVVSGPPGAGKTTLAHALADALAWPAVCRDEIKERLAGAGAGAAFDPAENLNLKALEEFFDTLEALLASGTSVVAEAAFQDHVWRPRLEPLQPLADIRIIRCLVDPEAARQRITRRATEQPSRAAHADAELLQRIADGQRPIESWVPIALDEPCLVVDSSEGWEPPLPRIVEFARAGSPPKSCS